MMQKEQLAVERIVDNLFVNSLYQVPADYRISDFLIRSVECIVRMMSLCIGGKGNVAMTLRFLLC